MNQLSEMDIFKTIKRFPDQETCLKYLEKVRWNNEPTCTKCGKKTKQHSTKIPHRYFCQHCLNNYSVTMGTIFHKTKVPLQKWFMAIFLMNNATKGISARQLSGDIGLPYKTTWSLCMRIRQSMISEPKMLRGILEMDESFVGGKPRHPNNVCAIPERKRELIDMQLNDLKGKGINIAKGKTKPKYCDVNVKRGRGSQKQTPLVGIVQRNGDVVAQVMGSLTFANMKKMVEKHVKKEKSVLITDQYKGYNRLNQIINHIMIDHKKAYSYRNVNTNTIESFWAIVKRGIVGQYHHVSPEYLPLYVIEFVHKYNNRKKKQTARFQKTIRQAT